MDSGARMGGVFRHRDARTKAARLVFKFLSIRGSVTEKLQRAKILAVALCGRKRISRTYFTSLTVFDNNRTVPVWVSRP